MSRSQITLAEHIDYAGDKINTPWFRVYCMEHLDEMVDIAPPRGYLSIMKYVKERVTEPCSRSSEPKP
jgi:hypothetical protein